MGLVVIPVLHTLWGGIVATSIAPSFFFACWCIGFSVFSTPLIGTEQCGFSFLGPGVCMLDTCAWAIWG